MSEMIKRTELPDEVRSKIDNVLKAAGDAHRQVDLVQEEILSLNAWNLLPEPKLGWEFYSNIIPRDNMIFFRDTNQFDKALHWLDITRKSYGSTKERPDQVIEFYAATIYFEMGRYDDAFAIFDWQYKKWKTLPFKGADKKYLDFYLRKKAKRS
ncbi:hypothetical protein LQ948_18750 [Jiella sp. MQZ9-1]|uniref:Uncharacterized protein n=1 Tax=Jiella flava TaxID=2816857 RepID=A0A939FZS1_9HYPH|nr:hypothetical protein [Jiella flava]MBO0664590.1 hypothetical protein [Jiella flava]MCD2473228.1 hypothetical protein [Jiella flava]